MKVLVLGPSGSGKTYIANALKSMCVPAFDDGDIPGLSGWYNCRGRPVPEPATATEALTNKYSFIWHEDVLAHFLQEHNEAYIFGGAGNIFSLLHLFDKVYFLKIGPALQKERISNANNRNTNMDFTEDQMVIWGNWFEQEAAKHNIQFIDASLTPREILSIMRNN